MQVDSSPTELLGKPENRWMNGLCIQLNFNIIKYVHMMKDDYCTSLWMSGGQGEKLTSYCGSLSKAPCNLIIKPWWWEQKISSMLEK